MKVFTLGTVNWIINCKVWENPHSEQTCLAKPNSSIKGNSLLNPVIFLKGDQEFFKMTIDDSWKSERLNNQDTIRSDFSRYNGDVRKYRAVQDWSATSSCKT